MKSLMFQPDRVAPSDAIKAPKKAEQLRSIKVSLNMCKNGKMGRRYVAAISFVPIALLAGLIVAEALKSLGFQQDPLSFVCGFLAIGILTFLGVLRYSTLPLTCEEELLKKLTDYEPLDRGTYSLLQSQTRARGDLRMSDVERWIDFEQGALTSVTGKSDPNIAAFINKKS